MQNAKCKVEDIVEAVLKNRGIKTAKEIKQFLNPTHPNDLTSNDVGISPVSLKKALARINKAIKNKESIVVYADYDADGVCAGAIMWEALHDVGAQVMPYIPHRVEEGYGLSTIGIDKVVEQYHPALIITVDHGITAHEKVAYAQKKEIDVIVTDHHVKPAKLPDCTIVHTTKLCGAGIAWFVVKELLGKEKRKIADELLSLATIGTIADMVPLVGPNRSIVKFGLSELNNTSRTGLVALMQEAGILKGSVKPYVVSHILAPRLNAMGRLEHALDALRLLCTKQEAKAFLLAQRLGTTNKERQNLTETTVRHAIDIVVSFNLDRKKLLFIAQESYNQGVIGLVAGKLVEVYYRPTIVIAKGEIYSKASARSIVGFNIVEAIRSCSDILVDVGGHPMAAGFTVESKNLNILEKRLTEIAEKQLDETKLVRTLRVDAVLSLDTVTQELWQALQTLEPFGFGNHEPIFATRNLKIVDSRLVGAEKKHIKLTVSDNIIKQPIDAIAFGFGQQIGSLKPGAICDLAYSIDVNSWNGRNRLQLKVKDLHFQK